MPTRIAGQVPKPLITANYSWLWNYRIAIRLTILLSCSPLAREMAKTPVSYSLTWTYSNCSKSAQSLISRTAVVDNLNHWPEYGDQA